MKQQIERYLERSSLGRVSTGYLVMITTVTLTAITTIVLRRRRQRFRRKHRELIEARRLEEASALEAGLVSPKHWSIYIEGRFVNPYEGWHDHTLKDVLCWFFGPRRDYKPKSTEVNRIIRTYS
jgi:hypothetical protein